MNIFRYDSYKKFLVDLLDSPEQRGRRSQMAKHLGCQSGFISQVLNGDRHFSAEAMIEISEFLGLGQVEQEYFLQLFYFERAGSVKLRDYHELRLENMRLSRQRLPIDDKRELNREQLAAYHSHWRTMAIHTMIMESPKVTKSEISSQLSLPMDKVESTIAFLNECGVLQSAEDGNWEAVEINNSVGRDSLYIDLIHKNIRLEVIKSLDRRQIHDSHYSRFIVLDQQGVSMVQEEIAEFIQKLTADLEGIERSGDTKLFGLCFDVFGY